VQETVIGTQASLMYDYYVISAPEFFDNIPQAFAPHLLATIFDLFNAGPIDYQSYSHECVLANIIPQMCGALVDMGTVDDSSCKDKKPSFRDTQIVQMPELFSFNNIRREIQPDEYPNNIVIPSTYAYAATLVHEFVHDLEDDPPYFKVTHREYDRRIYCSPSLMDFLTSHSPFEFNGPDGSQAPADFVSSYAGGLSSGTYLHYEDVAESVSAYMLIPEYFRKRAQSSVSLQNKYDYIRDHIFGGTEFYNPHLSEVVDYPFPNQVKSFFYFDGPERFVITDITASSSCQPETNLEIDPLCEDGSDNDCNGLTDCDDAGCSDSGSCLQCSDFVDQTTCEASGCNWNRKKGTCK
jgi:hypothetical protein